MGRTKKIIQLGIPENPSKIKGSRAGGYRIATVISSQPRYVRLRFPKFISLTAHEFRPLPPPYARCICRRQRSHRRPLRYRCKGAAVKAARL